MKSADKYDRIFAAPLSRKEKQLRRELVEADRDYGPGCALCEETPEIAHLHGSILFEGGVERF